jgi:hypothetical protein
MFARGDLSTGHALTAGVAFPGPLAIERLRESKRELMFPDARLPGHDYGLPYAPFRDGAPEQHLYPFVSHQF